MSGKSFQSWLRSPYDRRIFLLVSLLLVSDLFLSHALLLSNLHAATSFKTHSSRFHTKLAAKSRARNKQAELAEKLARAKEQQLQASSPTTTNQNQYPEQPSSPLKKQEQKQQQKSSTSTEEFGNLLKATRGALPRKGDDSFDDEQAFLPDIQAGKTKQKVVKKKKPPTPKPKKKKIAQRIHFEKLIGVETNQALGAMGAAELVPWVPPFLVDKLVVLCDPRQSSADLRKALHY